MEATRGYVGLPSPGFPASGDMHPRCSSTGPQNGQRCDWVSPVGLSCVRLRRRSAESMASGSRRRKSTIMPGLAGTRDRESISVRSATWTNFPDAGMPGASGGNVTEDPGMKRDQPG
jgi:hypothetical protein